MSMVIDQSVSLRTFNLNVFFYYNHYFTGADIIKDQYLAQKLGQITDPEALNVNLLTLPF